MVPLTLPRWPLTGRQREMAFFQEAVATRNVNAVLVHGPLGAGKTRLAEEGWNMAGGQGFELFRATASRAAQSVPLGAIGHLLPRRMRSADPGDLTTQLAHRFSRPARRVALMVDDLPLLDAASAVIVRRLAETGTILMIGTVRSDLPSPAITAEAREAGHFTAIDLEPLDVDAVEVLLGETLDGIVPRSTALRLHAASGGRPRFLRDLVTEALRTDVLRKEGETWHLIGAPAPSRRLQEAICYEMRGLPEQEAVALKLSALCHLTLRGPLETEGLSAGTLSRLEQSHLVDVKHDGEHTIISMRHPLYAEVLCSQMGLLERRGLLLTEAERLRHGGMRRRSDPLRAACMHLESTGTADPHLLRQALPLALSPYDAERVATLSKALTWVDPTSGPRITLSTALFRLGRPADALAMLDSAAAGAADAMEDLQIKRLRSSYEMFSLLGFDEPDYARIIALINAGGITQARNLAEEAHKKSVAQHELIPQLWTSYCLGQVEYRAGRLNQSYGWYSTCAHAARTMHDGAGEGMALTGMALAAGGMGRPDLLDTALIKAKELAPAQQQSPEFLAASAWRLVMTSNLSQARDLLLEAATLARKTGAAMVEAQLLSDVARLGDPGRVKTRLAELASLRDEDLASALAAHAAALASRDPARLTATAAQLEVLGALLHAAESYSAAADLYTGQCLNQKASRVTGEAVRLAGQCAGAHTPGLALSQAQVPLTRREIEIAMLALRGLSSEDIAHELVVSPRTVHSHLQHIYRKAGITRRRDLRRILPNMNVRSAHA